MARGVRLRLRPATYRGWAGTLGQLRSSAWVGVIVIAMAAGPGGSDGCNSVRSLPTAPSGQSGVMVYEQPNFQGMVWQLPIEGNCPDLGSEDCNSICDDCISSIRLAAGWTATFYAESEFRGRRVAATRDVPDLRDVEGPCHAQTFDDCVSSIRWLPP